MRSSLLFLCLLLCAPFTAAQTKCRTYFKMVESDPHIPGGTINQMTRPQAKWLRSKEQKKYPQVCYDPQRASYAIVWTEEMHKGLVLHPAHERSEYTTYVSVAKIGPDGKLITPPLMFDTDRIHFLANFRSSSANALKVGVKFLATHEVN